MRSIILRARVWLIPVMLGLAILGTAPASAITLDTNAREAILLDFDTGQVLYEKNADELMPPASMSKIMTVYLAFERLKDGRLKMEDTVPVSEKAWQKGLEGPRRRLPN